MTGRAELPEEIAEKFRDYLKNSPHVVLVCVFQESLDARKQPDNHHLHVEATVVRSIKGDLKVGEKIRYFTLLEEVHPNRSSELGALKFLFLQDLPKGEFHLDVGEGWAYQPDLEKIITPKSD